MSREMLNLKNAAEHVHMEANELRAARFRFLELRERAVSSNSADALVVARLAQVCRRRVAR